MILQDINAVLVEQRVIFYMTRNIYMVLLCRDKTDSWPSSVGLRREELVCDGSWRCYILHLHHTPAVQVLYSVQVCLNLFPPYLYLPWIPAFFPSIKAWWVVHYINFFSKNSLRLYHYVQAMVGPACVATSWPWRWRCYQGEREGFEWQSPVRHPQHDQSEQGITNQSATKHLLFIWAMLDYT